MGGVELAGQFSYTACESPGPYSAVPGWKVKQVLVPPGRSDLPEAVVQAAVRTFGGFRPPEIGPLATQAEIDHAPRCLRLDRLPDGHRSLAHLAAAGRDRSGRDAFFAHGLILEAGTGRGLPVDDFGSPDRLPPDVRPADFWGADGWLTPFRAEAIERAELAAPPRLSPASPGDADRLVDFLDLHGEQLEFMLAAAERALTGGPPVVVAGMPAAAAMWTSLITHLMPPDVGWTVPFSTYETRLPGDESAGHPFLLWGVPPAVVDAAPHLPADRGTLCDPRSPAAQDADGYRLPDGSALPVGPWAQVAIAVHALGWAVEVRGLIDDLPGAGDGSWPLFALPAVVLALPSDRLEQHQQLARQAAAAAATYFPTSYDLPRELLRQVMDATVRWGESPRQTTRSILRTWDEAGSPPPAPMADPVLATYVRELLKPGALTREGQPWLPGSIGLSTWAQPGLLDEIPRAIGWLHRVEPFADRAWLLLAVTDLLERLGLTTGASGHDLRALLVDAARGWMGAAVVSRALAGSTSALPPIPTWLWQDALLDTFTAELEADPQAEPGVLLRDARLRALLDDAAGPLPRTREPGVLTRMSAVDWERAAAALRFPPRQQLDREAHGVWRAAAFLRTAVGVGRRRDPRQWSRELGGWFIADPIDADLLRDVIAELPDDPGGLMDLARTALDRLPPSATTAQIATTVLARSRMTPPLAGALAWHRQFAVVLPFTTLDAAPLPVQPDHPENELLTRVARGDLPAALMPAGQDRLIRWLLVMSAQFVHAWVGPDGAARPWWGQAGSDTWRRVLTERVPVVVDALQVDLAVHRRQWPTAADGLVAEWVVRSALAEQRIGFDPLTDWFTASGAKDGWQVVARELLGTRGRSRETMEKWVEYVRRRADRVASGPLLSREELDMVVDGAASTAAALAGTGGLFGRLRRPSTPRRG